MIKQYFFVSNNYNQIHVKGYHMIKHFRVVMSCEKLLRIKVDSRLNFNEHLDGIIKKASRLINALSRITPFMNISKRHIFMNSFFNWQFIYCHLVWMFHSRLVNNKINHLHERVLRIVHSDLRHLWKPFRKTWNCLNICQKSATTCNGNA